MDRAEAAGLGVSVVGHGALLAAAWFVVTRTAGPIEMPRSIEVSYVDEIGMTSTSPTPTPAAAPPAAEEEGPVEQAAPAPDPVPEPVTEPAPRPTPAPAPAQRQAQPRPAPAQPARPQPARQGGRGSAQANRAPGLRDLNPGSFGTDPRRRPDGPAANYGPAQRASVRQALARALARCQRQPLPAPEAAAIRVEYRVTLNPDGSLASAQFLRVLNSDASLERYEGRMRDIALNVINACTPIRGLPAEYYDVPGGWRQFPYQFDPRTVR